MDSVLSECAILASLFGLGFTASVLLVRPASSAPLTAQRPSQVCQGTQNPQQFSCPDCQLTYQSGIASGNNCTPCRYGFSWTITCGSFEQGGSQSDELACDTDPEPFTVACPGGGGTAFSFDFACGPCQ